MSYEMEHFSMKKHKLIFVHCTYQSQTALLTVSEVCKRHNTKNGSFRNVVLSPGFTRTQLSFVLFHRILFDFGYGAWESMTLAHCLFCTCICVYLCSVLVKEQINLYWKWRPPTKINSFSSSLSFCYILVLLVALFFLIILCKLSLWDFCRCWSFIVCMFVAKASLPSTHPILIIQASFDVIDHITKLPWMFEAAKLFRFLTFKCGISHQSISPNLNITHWKVCIHFKFKWTIFTQISLGPCFFVFGMVCGLWKYIFTFLQIWLIIKSHDFNDDTNCEIN